MDMLDDDIVYLGSRIPQSPSTARPSSQSPLKGIVLHVEKCGLVEAQRLAFDRDDMNVVQIGRRSGFDPDRRRSSDIEQEGAMFRCAVVSRKHAKIAFSDSGAAYLIDLNSHHGTHIRRPEEKYSKMIKPESPTLLHDGDIVTFGKTVGKHDEAVRPVTVRIELVYEDTLLSPSSNRATGSLFSVSPSLSNTTATKPSGRYGIHTSTSSSDNESYSIYSDAEDGHSSSPTPPPPVEAPAPLPPSEPKNKVVEPKPKAAFNAVNILRNLLPPLHPPTPRENLPSVADLMQKYFRPTPPLFSSLFDAPQSSRSDTEQSQPLGFDASHHDIYEPDVVYRNPHYRSESPMDLASTSPSPAPEVIVSRQLSIPPVFSPPPVKETTDAYKPPSVNLEELYHLPGIVPHPTSPAQSTSGASRGSSNPLDDTSDEMKGIRDTLTRLEDEVVKLNVHRKKYKARFNSNTELISQKLGEFYDKVDEANAECTMLYDKVDTIRSVDIPDIQAQVDMLEERMDKFEGVHEVCNDDQDDVMNVEHQPSMNEDEVEFKSGAAKVKVLIDELLHLHENAKKEVAAEIESIKTMRQAAMADIEKAKADVAAQALKFAEEHYRASPSRLAFRSGPTTPVPPSLKRKRDDTDENEDSDDGVFREDLDSEMCGNASFSETDLLRLAEELATEEERVVMDDIEQIRRNHPDTPSPRKRARRVASVIAHTATAVTIGAVVTWTALAFS